MKLREGGAIAYSMEGWMPRCGMGKYTEKIIKVLTECREKPFRVFDILF